MWQGQIIQITQKSAFNYRSKGVDGRVPNDQELCKLKIVANVKTTGTHNKQPTGW